MVEPNDDGNQGGNSGAGQGGASITLKVDKSQQMKDMEKQLGELQKQLEEEKNKVTTNTKTLEDKEKTIKELEEKAGDLESKLTVVAEEKFNARVTTNLGRVKKLFPEDDEKLKEFEKKLETPEDLKSVEYALDVLEESIAKGQQIEKDAFEKSKKELLEKFPDAKEKIETVKSQDALTTLIKELEDAGTGTGTGGTGTGGEGGTPPKPNKRDIPLSAKQLGLGGQDGKGEDVGYETYRAMIMDLRRRARDPSNPEAQAKAQETLEIMFHKWSDFVREDYRRTKDIEAALGSREKPRGAKDVFEGRDE